jgi:hypothetical protein
MAVDDPSDGAIRQGEPPYRSDPAPEAASKHKPAPSAAEDVERQKRASRGSCRGSCLGIALGGLLGMFLGAAIGGHDYLWPPPPAPAQPRNHMSAPDLTELGRIFNLVVGGVIGAVLGALAGGKAGAAFGARAGRAKSPEPIQPEWVLWVYCVLLPAAGALLGMSLGYCIMGPNWFQTPPWGGGGFPRSLWFFVSSLIPPALGGRAYALNPA